MSDLSSIRFGARFHITDKNKKYDSDFEEKAKSFIRQHPANQPDSPYLTLDDFGMVFLTNEPNGRQDVTDFKKKSDALEQKIEKRMKGKSAEEIAKAQKEGFTKLLKSYAKKPFFLAQWGRKLLSFVGLAKPIQFIQHEIK